MFRGNHPAKIDDKGRLKLPAAFKQLVDLAGVTQFYVTSVEGDSAQVWPLPAWEKREQQLAGASEMDEAVQKYLSMTSYYGQQVEMDSQARILVPQILRNAASLDDQETVVIGMGQFVEVHNRKNFEARMTANKLTSEDRARLAELTRQKQQ